MAFNTSSVMPSLKNSFSGSALRFAKGKTAMDLSGVVVRDDQPWLSYSV
jgi:hypothetical protein